MENVQLWLLGEMSSASLSGAGGLDSASDFPPRTLPLLPPPNTTPEIQEQERGQRDFWHKHLSPGTGLAEEGGH